MNDYDIEPGQSWEIDKMQPEDAEGVCCLFRSIYGQDYPIKSYIQPEILIQENHAGRILSSVARTRKGDIVGHNAIFHSAPSDGIFESGSGLVHKNYRHGNMFLELCLHCQQRAGQDCQASAIWGEPILSHPFSQKVTKAMDWQTFSLEIALMPAEAYVKEGSARGRVSAFMDFFILNPRPHEVLLPPVYEDQLTTLYAHLAKGRELSLSRSGPAPETPSQITTQMFSFAQMIRITVWRIGEDFQSVIAHMYQEPLGQEIQVIQIWLKLTDPAIGWAVDCLRSQGFFLGGLLPRWFEDDGLLMQKTLSPPDWNTMQIVFEQGQMIADIVRSDWQEVTDAGYQ